MNEQDRHDRIREVDRAQLARNILENPLWEDSFASYERSLYDIFSEPSSPEDLVLEARRMLIALHRLRRDFATVLQTGDLARIQLTEDAPS